MIGPKDVDQGGDQPAVAPDLQRLQRRPAGGADRGQRARWTRSTRCGRRSTGAGRLIVGLLDAIPGVTCPEPQGAFYAYPSVTGLIGRSTSTGCGRRRPASWPRWSWSRPRWRWCRARRSARPGYFRLSYALGDDDLVTGVTRMGEFLSHRRRTDPRPDDAGQLGRRRYPESPHRHVERRSTRAIDAGAATAELSGQATMARALPSTVCPLNFAVMSTRAVPASGSSAPITAVSSTSAPSSSSGTTTGRVKRTSILRDHGRGSPTQSVTIRPAERHGEHAVRDHVRQARRRRRPARSSGSR